MTGPAPPPGWEEPEAVHWHALYDAARTELDRLLATLAAAERQRAVVMDSAVVEAILAAEAAGCSPADLIAGIKHAEAASVCRRTSGPCTCGAHVTAVAADRQPAAPELPMRHS